jgi:hypothetical protein
MKLALFVHRLESAILLLTKIVLHGMAPQDKAHTKFASHNKALQLAVY